MLQKGFEMTRRRNHVSTCYMCERKYETKEHVPPRSFFPESGEMDNGIDYRRNLITVPSCKLHNLNKSDDDQYLLFVIVSGFRANETAQKMFSRKIVRAITRKPSLVSFFKNNFNVSLGGKQTIGYHVDRERFDRTISKFASALYYFCYKEK